MASNGRRRPINAKTRDFVPPLRGDMLRFTVREERFAVTRGSATPLDLIAHIWASSKMGKTGDIAFRKAIKSASWMDLYNRRNNRYLHAFDYRLIPGRCTMENSLVGVDEKSYFRQNPI